MKKEFYKSVKYNRKCQVNIWYMVAREACDVDIILTQKGFVCASLCEDFKDLTSPQTSNYIPD